MAFLGNSSSAQNFVPQTDFFSGDGSTVAFTLSRPVASVYQVEAVVANVVQNPSDAYTVNGNVITFTSAPPAGTNNVYVRFAALNTSLMRPGQGTVFPSNMSGGAPYWDANGGVGINTTSLGSNKLRVDGGPMMCSASSTADSIMYFRRNETGSNAWLGIPNWDNAALYIFGPTPSGNLTAARYHADGWLLYTNNASRLSIDSSGRVTMPYQPAFMAFRSNTSYGTSSWTTVANWSADFNTGSHFNTTTGVFTAPVAGRYLFTYGVRGNDGNSSAASVSIKINKNSTTYFNDLWGSVGITADGAYRNYVSGSVVMNMAANDTASLQAEGYLLQGAFSGILIS